MTKEDYGQAPMKAKEGIYFLTPSVGEDSGSRIMKFENKADLGDTKEYYDSMSEEGALTLLSQIYFNKKFQHIL